MFGRNPQGSHRPWSFVCWEIFDNCFNFPCWLRVCSGFVFLPVSVLVVCTSLGMHPFLPDCLVCWPIVVHTMFLKIVCISLVLVVISPLSFVILFIWILSLFFLLCLARGLSILLILNQLPVSLLCSTVLLVSISLISALVIINSLLLLHLGFNCCSFSSSFRCKVRLCI